MPEEISRFIINYGYLAICILIFIQEIGIPNPVPNEVVLLYAGYLSYTGLLNFSVVILAAVLSDILATSVLYFIFYRFGEYIIKNKPRWFPISVARIKSIEKKIYGKGKFVLFMARMTPFIRGYVTVIAGLVRIKPNIFFPVTVFSTLIWVSVCVIAGWLLGPSWLYVANKLSFSYVILFVVAVTAVILIIHTWNKKKKQ